MVTVREAATRDNEFAVDPQLVFHISVSDVLDTVRNHAAPREVSEVAAQRLLDAIISNRIAIREGILDAFGDFGMSDHHWSDAVVQALRENTDVLGKREPDPEADEFRCERCGEVGLIEQAATLVGDTGSSYVHEDCNRG